MYRQLARTTKQIPSIHDASSLSGTWSSARTQHSALEGLVEIALEQGLGQEMLGRVWWELPGSRQNRI